MNVMELFAGIGGGILGSMLCGHRIVCAVELDPYCRSVLIRRQNDGLLPPFPLWDDVRTFDGRLWQGIVDMVSGGFPCQNISPAGDRTGITGEKSSLWFDMLRIVREVRPQYVFVENSAGLIRNGLDVVLGGLDEGGFDAEWEVLGADDVGAPHIRKRCWILAKYRQTENDTDSESAGFSQSNQSMPVSSGRSAACRMGVYVPDSDGAWHVRRDGRLSEIERTDGQGSDYAERTAWYGTGQWWEIEPGMDRVADGVPYRLERIRGLGNAQVPLCAATAWKRLYERFNEK
jgi:DNA (cytosine-5)-methyltransferase 1